MKINIEVVYALPDEQVVIPLRVDAPITIIDAVHQSGILDRFPGLELADDMVGIFGHYLPLDHVVSDGDRVEIYRPLYMSPTDARKIRAEARRRRRGRDKK